jgi:hypothetical protein
VAERTGGGRRSVGFYGVLLLLALGSAWMLFSGVRLLWLTHSGPVVPVEIVQYCHGGKNTSTCTAVWRPTGEPEQTVSVRTRGYPLPHETVNVRIHGDEAFADDMRHSKSVWVPIGWGLVGIVVPVVAVVASRKSGP